MIKYEKAKKHFLKVLSDAPRITEYGPLKIAERHIRTVIDALDKQIPEKPKEKIECNLIGQMKRIFVCPKCMKKQPDEIFFHRFTYCSKCGKKIDWSDYEWKI